MTTRHLALSFVLLLLTACGKPSLKPYEGQLNLVPSPPPVALQACEAPPVEAPNSPLSVTEPNDAVIREQDLRCMIRHNAALQYLYQLYKAGYIPLPAAL